MMTWILAVMLLLGRGDDSGPVCYLYMHEDGTIECICYDPDDRIPTQDP